MVSVILFVYNHTNRSSVAADAVLQCECIVKPAADDFRMLCLVCDDSLGSVYAEAFRIAQPDSVFVCVQNRHGVEIASFLCSRDSGKLVASVCDGNAVQVLISFTFPCGAVLCVKLYVYESFCIQFVEPGKELTVCIADTAVNNLFILDCNTKFVHRKSEVTGHSLDMFVVRVGRERDFIGSVTVAVCILLFEGFQDCLKLVCSGRHAHANILQPFRIDVWAVSNGCIGTYVRNCVDVSVRCCHFFSYTRQIQDRRNVRAIFLKIIFQRNEYALVYTIGEDCIIA